MSRNRAEIPQKDALTIVNSSIFIVRNEAFEPYLAHAINCAAQIGVNLSLEFSEYNDSINFTEIPEKTNFVVLWLNWERIQIENLDQIFSPKSKLAAWARDPRIFFVLPSQHGLHNLSYFNSKLESLEWPAERQIEGGSLPDNKKQSIKLGFTRYELDSIVTKIGLQVTSCDVQLRIRALIMDLDNTLYRGVYGEDSEEDVFPEPFHLELHAKLKQLSDSGVLLCIASKNNPTDIDSILGSGLVSVLSKEDFVIIQGGWNSKTISVQRILDQLNFSEQFVAFVDDNKRELYEVASGFPNLLCLDGIDPESVLLTFSNLLTFEEGVSPEIIEMRSRDIKSSQNRFQVSNTTSDKDSMLVDLGTKVDSQRGLNSEERSRAMELFRKTNQFNLTLARTIFNDRDLQGKSTEVILTYLSDKISDSGPIAAVYYSIDGDFIEIKEFAISCRALGRDAEKYIFRSSLTLLDKDFESRKVFVNFVEGPKNRPAQQFVQQYFQKSNGTYILNTNKLMASTSKWYGDICEN
jgi:FkbH-like protein